MEAPCRVFVIGPETERWTGRLRVDGTEVCVAPDPARALGLHFREPPEWFRRPNLLVVDVSRADHPDELLGGIRAIPNRRAVPVVALTADPTPDGIAGLYAAGANAVVARPPGPEALRARLEGVIAYWSRHAVVPWSDR